jgi:polyisoprenoid-binding protein YceI
MNPLEMQRDAGKRPGETACSGLALLFLLHASLACPALAEPRRVELTPASSQVAIRAYGMGLLPIDADFAIFSGKLSYDPNNRAWCQVELRIQAASLIAGDASLRDTIAGPDFLDAARYPLLTYVGACEGEKLDGTLAMHGIARPFGLSLEWSATGVVAEGRLLRADWGMTAMPLVGGRTVRIRVSVKLAGTGEQTSHPGSKP